MNIVELWQRAYELQHKVKVAERLSDEVLKAWNLFNNYEQVLIDLNLYSGYINYRKERDEQRNCNKDDKNSGD